MKFVTFERRSGSPRAGLLLRDNRVLDLGLAYTRKFSRSPESLDDTQGLIDTLRGMSSSLLEILRTGEDSITECLSLQKVAEAGHFEDCLFPVSGLRLWAPLPDVPQILCFAGSRQHSVAELADFGVSLPDDSFAFAVPRFFMLGPTAVSPPEGTVAFPEGETRLDFEVHVATVLSEDVQHASPEDAEDSILGYTLALVWVSRDLQRENVLSGLGPGAAKGFGINLGPSIVTLEEMREPYESELVIRTGAGELYRGSAQRPDYSINEMISYASEFGRIPAGSVILSGPACGASGLIRGSFLKEGDFVEASFNGIGTVRGEIAGRRIPRICPRRSLK